MLKLFPMMSCLRMVHTSFYSLMWRSWVGLWWMIALEQATSATDDRAPLPTSDVRLDIHKTMQSVEQVIGSRIRSTPIVDYRSST